MHLKIIAIGDIMKKYYVTVSIKLRFMVNAKDKDEAMYKVENIGLPKGYVEDSFEIGNVVEADGKVNNDDYESIIVE